MEKIKVMVSGAAGKMGAAVIKAVLTQEDMTLVSALDHQNLGQDAGLFAGLPACGIIISGEIEPECLRAEPQVLVDFTNGSAAPAIIKAALAHNCAAVVGSSGISREELEEIGRISQKQETPVLLAPNFSIGANLLMEFARKASRYFNSADIIELHHEKKLDAPSGTALHTAEMMAQAGTGFSPHPGSSIKLEGVRGGEFQGIHIHSVRLPGLLAHQEVIFGGTGEVLTLRHDSMDRASFMPGVLLSIRKIRQLKGLHIGLDNIL